MSIMDELRDFQNRKNLTPEPMRPVTLRMPKRTRINLDDMAKKQGRTRSNLILHIVDEYLAKAARSDAKK